MCCGRVDAVQLKVAFTTGPKTHPTLFVDLRGRFLAGNALHHAYVLKTFSKVSTWNTRYIPDRSSYRQFLRVIECPLNAIQLMKRDGAEDSRGKPRDFVHQGSPSPQYWNANLKRTAHPSPLSAGCFSATDYVSTVPPLSLSAGELTPVMPNEVVP